MPTYLIGRRRWIVRLACGAMAVAVTLVGRIDSQSGEHGGNPYLGQPEATNAAGLPVEMTNREMRAIYPKCDAH